MMVNLKLVVYFQRKTVYQNLYSTILETTHESKLSKLRTYKTFIQFQNIGLMAGHGKHYIWAERSSHLITMAYTGMILTTSAEIIFQPFIIVGLRYLDGTLQSSDWKLPYYMM